MKKHAYLIIAHNQPELLLKLLNLLDDEKNDIYVHVDKKWKDFQKEKYVSTVKKSKIYWTKRTNVKWGDFSLINCELLLLKQAVTKKYCYYHLISGADLPIKSQKEIHYFFEKNKGLEFIDYSCKVLEAEVLDRVKYYHILCSRNQRLFYEINNLNIKIQKMINIDRVRRYNKIHFQKGRQWFSISHEFALYVLEREEWIQKVFRYSLCGDEMFLQTLVINSPFEKRVCNNFTMPEVSDTRYIDWDRGIPYVFREKDYLELKNSKALFARKFDNNVDRNIIEKIYRDLKQ